MAAPFSFSMPSSGAAFTMGVAAAAPTAAAASASSSSAAAAAAGPSVHVPSVLRADVFPANLSAASLPPASLLLVVPALHPHRGRVLLSAVAREPGQPLLCETAVVASNWDSFRCSHCDKPHATKRCAGAKKLWAKRVLNHLSEVEGSIMEASSIGSLDHARSFLKLLLRYFSDSLLGVGGARGPLADFLSLSSYASGACAASLGRKLPYQSASAKDVLEDVGAWPPGLSLEDAGRILSILNTNSHELSDIRGSGVFLRASLMEHQCVAPNCNFSTTGREMQILALRHIAPGENLSIDYGMGMYRPVDERRKGLLKSHGFLCMCIMCTARPDKSRAFSCPTVLAGGAACPGIVYPVGPDDKEAERKAWEKLVAEGAAFVAEQQAAAARAAAAAASSSSAAAAASPSPFASSSSSAAAAAVAGGATLLPIQSAPTTYPVPSVAPWSCTSCGCVLNQAQVAQCIQREKEAMKAMRGYRDEEDDEEAEGGGPKFDFERRDEDEEEDDDEDEDAIDDEEEEDDGDEIRPPFAAIDRLVAQSRPALHESHHIFFWSLEFYARSCSSDAEFAQDAIPIFQRLIKQIGDYLSPDLVAPAHDSFVVFEDYLAQVQVVVGGATEEARASFGRALAASRMVNGPNHHSSIELEALVKDTPESAEELQTKYAQFQANIEALIYDTKQKEVKDQNKGAGGKKKKKQSRSAKRRGEATESDEASDDGGPEEADEGPQSLAVTPATQQAILAQMEALMLQKAELQANKGKDLQGDDEMKTAAATAKGKKGKGKKK